MPRTSASTTPSTSSRAPAGWSAATRGPRSPPAQVEPISSSSRSRPRTHCKLIGSQTDFAPHAPVFRGRTASRRDMEPNRNGNGLGRLAVFLPAQRSPPTGRLIRELREFGQWWPPISRELGERDPAPVHRRHQRLERQFGRSDEHTSELQSRVDLVCRLLLDKKQARVALTAGGGRHRIGGKPAWVGAGE